MSVNVSFGLCPHNIAVKPEKAGWGQFDHPTLVVFLRLCFEERGCSPNFL